MKYNFKQIFALGTSVLLIGMTMGMVGAANYPNPFVVGGSDNSAVVYGTGADVSELDLLQAGYIQSNLQTFVTASGGTATGTGGDFKSMASGSDLLYLNDEFGENIQTLTSTELGTVLADGTFVDDGGTNYDYEQTIAIGSTSGYNKFEFGNSDNDFDDPALMLDLEETTGREIYNLTVTFSKAVNFTASDSEGEEIDFFGKTFTVGTATDDNTLILLGGADSTRIEVGATATMTVDSVAYTVSLDGLSSDTATKAGITVNGVYKSLTEGQTKTFVMDDGTEISVYAKTVFRTGDSGTGYVQVELGSDRLTLEHATNVQSGSDNDDIDGTYIFMTPTSATGMQALTKMVISVVAEDNDLNHVLVGDTFVDPLFGTVEVQFKEVINGPEFTDEEDEGTGRTALELVSGGDRELEVTLTDKNGYTKTVPFTYQDTLQDSNSDLIFVGEGQFLEQDDYVFLNSGNYEHFMQVTKISIDADDVADDDITLKDVITGTSYTLTDKDLGYANQTTTVTINSQVYTITVGGAINTTHINITSSDFAKYEAVYPYIELVSGEDYPRVALTDTVAISTKNKTVTAATNGLGVASKIYELPTGTLQFRLTDHNVAAATNETAGYVEVEYRVDASTGWTDIPLLEAAGGNLTSIAVNEGVYVVGTTLTAGNAATFAVANFSVDTGLSTAGTADFQTSPGILYVENKDKSDSDAKNVIFINTTDDSTSAYSEYQSVAFSGTTEYDTQAWDETKLTGYLTNWGTYALKDQTDTNQYVMRLTYPDEQMYANVYFAEVGASISTTGLGGALGAVLVKDTEVSSVSSRNLIVVGGSCINSAAAALVGGAYCGAAWTDATGVGSGEFLIKSYTGSSITSAMALLVAGYDVADTVNAATYLRTQTVDTSTGGIGTTETAALTAFA